MKNKSPCIDCNEREPACQSRCDIGREYWARDREHREKVKAARIAENIADTAKVNAIRRTKHLMGR